MDTFLPPIEKPAGLMMKLAYNFTRLQFGKVLVPLLMARIRSEEALLRTQFGEKYDAYCRRTSRLIPGLY